MSPPLDPDAFNAFEAEGWEAKSGAYGTYTGRITARMIEPLLDAAGVGPGVRVLDVATGPGYAAGRAAERGARAVGVDIAAGMVEIARRAHPELEFRVGDAEALPFGDAEFDAVVGNFVLLHLGRPERAVAEAARVLAPGGRAAFTVWDVPERMRILGVFLDALREAGAAAPADIPEGPPFFRFADDAEFAGLLRERGLDDAEVRTVSFVQDAGTVDELWTGILSGAVRTGALVERQPEEVRRRIRAALEQAVEPYRTGDRLEIPVSVKLASGRRP